MDRTGTGAGADLQRFGRARRLQRIAAAVMDAGSVTSGQLAEEFGVSLMTIHRDLDELAGQGLVRRFHGGASAQPSSVFEANINYRMRVHRAEKQALARHVIDLVEPGSALMLDDSTTTLEVAKLVTPAMQLTVVTNARQVLDVLREQEETRVILAGGEYSRAHDSYLGTVCTDTISRLSVDVLVMSTSAMSSTHLFHQETDIVEVKRAMMQAARRTLLLMDHTKVSRTALHAIADLRGVERLVVDSATPPEFIEVVRGRGLRVDVVDVAADAERDEAL